MNIQKRLYKYAYYYAHICQKNFFYIYLKKYIKKHRKYRIINNKEYDILSQIIIDNQIIYENENNKLKTNENDIVEYLYTENYRLYLLSKSDYTLDVLIEYHQSYIIKQMTFFLENNYQLDLKCINDIVLFSINLRRSFFNSEITAKSKVQEHWIARLPLFIFCVSCIFIIKLIDLLIYSNKNVYITIVLYIFVYIISIVLVFIRVHQSIIADTKKNLGEVYYKSKKLLYKNIINEAKIDLNAKRYLLYDEKEKIDIKLENEKN